MSKVTIDIDLSDIDEKKLLEYVATNYCPTDVYEDLCVHDLHEEQLTNWAKDSGYINKTELPEDLAILYS